MLYVEARQMRLLLGFRPPFAALSGIALPHSSQKALSGGFAAPQPGQAFVGTAFGGGTLQFLTAGLTEDSVIGGFGVAEFAENSHVSLLYRGCVACEDATRLFFARRDILSRILDVDGMGVNRPRKAKQCRREGDIDEPNGPNRGCLLLFVAVTPPGWGCDWRMRKPRQL